MKLGDITKAYQHTTRRILAYWQKMLEKQRIEDIQKYMREQIEDAQKENDDECSN